ncbi:MAG: hypothetical protein M3Z35_08630 [Nitrospirota bacterium]|nr:hypothetical protein [Nitrospirota bacterium]
MLREAHVLATALESVQGVRAVSLAGAMRRKLEVINELVFVLMPDRTRSVAQLAARVQGIPNMTEVSCHRDTVTARSPLGLPVVIKIAAPRYYSFEIITRNRQCRASGRIAAVVRRARIP